MKLNKIKVIAVVMAILALGAYYYVALPAINIHAAGFWFFIISIIVACIVLRIGKKALKHYKEYKDTAFVFNLRSDKVVLILGIIFVTVLAVYLVGSVISSQIINAKRYQKLLTIEDREFT